MVGGDASENQNAPTITVTTGSNMPVPPVYRGSTKKEKKALMDSYLIYKRRVTALNQGAYGRVFVMPLSACIDHRTLIRIYMYELGTPESEITEEDWKAYFLAARRPEVQDHARLAQAMRSLSMNTTLPDAESRVMKLVTDCNEILDVQDMDDFTLESPKTAVEFLCAALKPPALKQTVITELKRTMHKSTKKSVKIFLDWLRSRVSAFLIFESAIQRTTGAEGSQAHQQSKPNNVSRNNARFQSPRAGAAAVAPGPKPSSVGSDRDSTGAKLQGAKKSSTPGQPRKCFKCGDGLTVCFSAHWQVRQKRRSYGLPPGMGDILLSEGVMERLGYNAQALLDQARSISGVYDMDEDEAPPGVCSVLAYAAATSIHPEPTPEEKELQPGKEQRCFPDIDDTQDREEARALEWGIIEGKLDEAANLGCSSEFRAKLAELLSEYRDVFRIKLGQDPPVDMSPFKVTLKPDAVPVRCKARHYAPEDRAFMKKHVQELIDAGLCYRNPHRSGARRL
ncbi:hypothetical protein PF005_g14970 [Phytophthora fragariae]|uniref:Uncharacterized protein n=2 Tax=Phytophthora fragariae TaxID=53985 RepID=A0A6A3XZ05_9STRA|nr:hypothetical protein PF005_g14970 [Phytophthora fragariae]KAE9210788.1 hypothetical protein PF002_g18723 [Phytophthora fragariae]